MYADFAQVYDRLMQDVDYTGWASYYSSLLEKAGIQPGAAITECACGTGSLTLPLCENYQMTGLDISQEMLSVAAKKLRLHGKQLPLIRQDMQKMTLHRRQDAILATCDGVNYLLDDMSLQRFFKSAFQQLKPGGAFQQLKPGGALCFDVSSEHKLQHTLGNHTLTSTQGDVHYIWYNDFDETSRLLQIQLHLYVKKEQEQWQYLLEQQLQRAWSRQELKVQLEKAGFSEVTFYGDRTYFSPQDQSPRIHVLATKST